MFLTHIFLLLFIGFSVLALYILIIVFVRDFLGSASTLVVFLSLVSEIVAYNAELYVLATVCMHVWVIFVNNS